MINNRQNTGHGILGSDKWYGKKSRAEERGMCKVRVVILNMVVRVGLAEKVTR